METMKTRHWAGSIAVVLSLCAPAVSTSARATPSGAGATTGLTVIVTLKPGVNINTVDHANDGTRDSSDTPLSAYLVTLPASEVTHLRATSGVDSVEPDASLQVPELGAQQSSYSFHQGGMSGRDYADQYALGLIGVDDAHRVSTGQGVVVAVVDTGVDASHPDLQGHLLPGFNVLDPASPPADQPAPYDGADPAAPGSVDGTVAPATCNTPPRFRPHRHAHLPYGASLRGAHTSPSSFHLGRTRVAGGSAPGVTDTAAAAATDTSGGAATDAAPTSSADTNIATATPTDVPIATPTATDAPSDTPTAQYATETPTAQDATETPTNPADDPANGALGHGTGVTGIIAAVAPGACIMPIKVLDSAGYGTVFGVAEGIVYAVTHGARVINLSLGTASRSRILSRAINYATRHGVVVVASAGNSGDGSDNYPAKDRQVLAVAATDAKDQKADFSTYADWVAVDAPGVDIYSTYYDGRYALWSGTSLAAPFVSGEAALLRAQHPRAGITAIDARIRNSATPIGDQNPDYASGLGAGRIDLPAALSNQ